jgi:hypothetical protein
VFPTRTGPSADGLRISANVTGHFGIVTDAGLGGVARGEL